MRALGSKGQIAIARAISELDPDGDYVQLDVTQKIVRYGSEITAHEQIGAFTGEEEIARAYIVAWLIRVGSYPASCIELEKRYPSGRSALELDIRLTDEAGAPYALIEVKSPGAYGDVDDPLIDGQLFAPASREPGVRVLSLATVEFTDNDIVVRSVTIDYLTWTDFTGWKASGQAHRDDVPLNYDEATIAPFVCGGDRDLRSDTNQRELDRIRQRLHDRLWGGSNDDNAIYAWLVRVFLTKVHDEKATNDGEPYACQVLHHGSRPEPVTETAARVNKRWREAFHQYIATDGADPDPLNSGLFDARDLAWVIKILQNISLTSAGQNGGDLLGSFFEAITREGFKQSKGLFFTHYNIAAFMVEVLGIADLAATFLRQPRRHITDRLPFVIDPSCGSGTFLMATMRAVTARLTGDRAALGTNRNVREALERWLPSRAPNTWASEFLYGIEKREDLAASTKVNMVLHQDGHTHIYNDDALAPLDDIADRHREEKFRTHHSGADGQYKFPVAETMDVVITNPPFSLTLDVAVQADLASTFSLAGERNSENLFVERWFQLLGEGGRLGAVLPESFFSTAENETARRFLFAHFHVRAIVSLPPHAFQPWTPTRTSLLFAKRKTNREIARWNTTYSKHESDLQASLGAARRVVTRLLNPQERDTEASLGKLAAQLSKHLRDLDVAATHDPDRGLLLDELRESLKTVDTASLAFRRTVDATAPEDSYVGITVNEIGYRRTKRGEAARRNDLFAAVSETENGAVIVRNITLARRPWRIVSDEAETAVAILHEANLWR